MQVLHKMHILPFSVHHISWVIAGNVLIYYLGVFTAERASYEADKCSQPAFISLETSYQMPSHSLIPIPIPLTLLFPCVR